MACKTLAPGPGGQGAWSLAGCSLDDHSLFLSVVLSCDSMTEPPLRVAEENESPDPLRAVVSKITDLAEEPHPEDVAKPVGDEAATGTPKRDGAALMRLCTRVRQDSCSSSVRG
jgi:hypothetical protein